MIKKLLKPHWIIFLLLVGVIALVFISEKRETPSVEKQTPSKALTIWVDKTRERCQSFTAKEELDGCYRGILQEAVKVEGTKEAVEVLELLRSEGVIDAKFDDHQHVHEIGRATAKIKGLNVDAFLLCPSTYNYGCQHGFFEYALSQTDSYKEAAEIICENIGTDKPPKLYSYCYHGVGHGLMMSLAYDLMESIKICDQLTNRTAIEGCWQGAFMENTNLAVTDEEKVRWISKTDPLYPCNAVEEKYQWQCYINHAGYLMKRTNMSIPKASEICLSAPKDGTRPCIQSIGLMTTNPIWQKAMRGIDTILDPKKNVEIAWSMCQEMPRQAQRDCIIGAVGNIHNFDELNIDRSSMFCGLVEGVYKHDCYGQIGTSVAGLVINRSDAQGICQNLAQAAAKQSCLWGVDVRRGEQRLALVLSQEDEEKLIKDDSFTKRLIGMHGPANIIEQLAQIMPKKDLSCHDRAHEVGRFSYEIRGAQAFKECSSLCHSGCYHGATEAFFRDKGTARLEQNIQVVCQGELNKFFRHQCVHGVGHGLMAWADYELPEALSACDTLPDNSDRSSCWTGVFMENVVGGLSSNAASGHFTRYISSDPQYPCNAVEDKYKGACYFLQTSRMLQLFGTDFQKIAQACLQAPRDYRISCFQSMGRDVSGGNKRNVTVSIAACQHAPMGEYRRECLGGAVQDTFWDESGREQALTFCSRLSDGQERKRCYEIITQRAAEVLIGAAYTSFCQRIPSTSGVSCGDQAAVANVQEAEQSQQTGTAVLSKATNTSSSITIVMEDNKYNPKEVTIKRGTKVIFKNNSSDARWPASNIHPTHQIFPEFDPKKPMKKGESWEFTFNKTGTWRFHDHLYPSLTGTITVIE